MKVYFRQGSPLDRLETDPAFDAELPSETVSMYRRRMQQLRAFHSETDITSSRALDVSPVPDLGPDFFSIHICSGQRLLIHLLGDKPRREVAVLEIVHVKHPARRVK
jgi:hypothetical protein